MKRFKFSLSLDYMELKVVIDKKFAFIILGAILILAGAIYGYAQSGVPNPGHDWNEIGNVPADLADGDADTWNEISGIPAGFLDGIDNFEADTDTNTNAVTICGNNRFLDGDGDCRTTTDIVSAGGGGGSSICTYGSLTYTVGAVCTTGCYESGGLIYSRKHKCQSSGSWLDQGLSVGCGPECGGG